MPRCHRCDKILYTSDNLYVLDSLSVIIHTVVAETIKWPPEVEAKWFMSDHFCLPCGEGIGDNEVRGKIVRWLVQQCG